MKKQQVLVIHGGGSFIGIPREKLAEHLAGREVDIDRLRRKEDWKAKLQENLGDEYDVLSPRMPNPDQPLFIEWKTWFDQILKTLDDELILVGHSLGGMFLIKYLSEHVLGKSVRGLFSVAAPFQGDDEEKEPFRYSGFSIGEDLSKLSQAEALFLYHSTDDKVVPFSELYELKSRISNCIVRELEGRGHFNDANFPEIVEDIKNLA